MMKEAGEFVPKQDMIDAILKDLEIANETADTISKEDVAAQIATDMEQPGGLLESVLKETEALAEDSKATPDTGKGVDAQVQIEVAPDLMSARIRITPPEGGGRGVSEDDILERLRENRIIKGIKFEYVYRLANHTVYNRAFKIAQGSTPVDGEDARPIYRFEKVEWPTVFRGAEDYAKIQYSTVKSGDLLCELEPATPARNGWNIEGKLLPGKEGKTLGDIAGSNTMQMNAALYATCDGLVSIQGDKINVYNARTVRDLDNAKVKFEGTLLVEGNVVNSSVVEAEGDIIVKGSVQNSKLSAKGNIIVGKGITGNCTVEAGESLRCYFIENARIKAGKDITTDVVMRADVSCGGTLRLSGKRRNLLGGVSTIGGDLYANNIGNSANIVTEVCLLGKENIRKKKEAVAARIDQCHQALEKLIQTLQNAISVQRTAEEKKKLAIDIMYAKKKLEKEIEIQNKLLKEYEEKESAASSGKVIVSGTLYPNVNLNIDGVSHKNEKEQAYCTITKHRAELLFSAGKEGM